jgi:tRNA(Arg) A34 adenosine deaminase TadA
MNDEDYMRLAIGAARLGVEEGQSPFAACIVKDGEILCCMHNHVWRDLDSTAHAEIVAIREACKKLHSIDLKGCVIYSTCEPCPMCFAACHWAKISKIIYGARIADAQSLGFSELSLSNLQMKREGKSPIEIVGDCLRNESLELMKAWSKRSDRRAY